MSIEPWPRTSGRAPTRWSPTARPAARHSHRRLRAGAVRGCRGRRDRRGACGLARRLGGRHRMRRSRRWSGSARARPHPRRGRPVHRAAFLRGRRGVPRALPRADPANARFFADGRRAASRISTSKPMSRTASRPRGVGKVEALGLDTYAEPDRFYSYRRATHRGEADYGRQLSAIALATSKPGSTLARAAGLGAKARATRRTFLPTADDISGATPHHRPPRPSPTRIGNHKLKPATLMMGYGFDPALSRRLAQAADLPHLDLRVRECRGRQALLRGRDRQAPGRRRGPRLFALQRPQPGNPRGPARRLGRGRGGACLLQRHVGDRDPAADLRPARRRRRPFGPALRRDRDADRQDPRPVRRSVGRLPGRRRRARRSTPSSPGPRRRAAVALIYLESPANPTNALVDVEAVAAARDAAFGADEARRSRSTTPSSGRCGPSRSPTARTSRLQPDQICRRALATSSPAASSARRR